jgi:tRNA A-37 threonylcarbamoyl transferase component Bud32
VKDYGPRCALIRRVYGRPTLRREAAVYARLADVRGIPQCLGFDGPDRLVLGLAPGRSLRDVAPGTLSAAVFDELDRVVAGIHARGVAIADLHRSNVLVDDGGRVHIVDFAVARIARSAGHHGWFVRQLQQLDRHAAARLRAMHFGLPAPRPSGLFGLLYRAGRAIKPR